ncbi:hypothetical protein DN069_10140 [Streptacidiphilus pinicola]|uniref:DUF3592 domain-containing protein n=1 Tax=Streptacidiphilus pinicola TaxID=2219663 RepID=A0A2X0IL62_9ACTN|nr:hypothetical protein DN069_10140 [Streptacidiphilus pinicola]
MFVAILTPLLLAGFGVLASNPDYGAALVGGVAVMIAGLYGLLAVASRGWLVLPGVLLVIALLSVPAAVFPSEIMLHRGVRTDVVVTAAHSSKGKNGTLSWTCDIRRVDGKPLPHATLGDSDCWGTSQVGTTETVLVDPDGWAPPVSTDVDYSGLDTGGYLVGVAAVLWALLVLSAARGTLRRLSAES